MKIALIEVGLPTESLSWTAWVDDDGRFAAPTLSLLHLASLTPAADEVVVFDEKVDGSAEHVEADLVGISFKTMYAARAYEVADALRKKGTKVVLGGLHVTHMPDEAALHADAVVVGEGEAVWPLVVEDVRHGRLGARYDAPQKPASLEGLELRVDLLRHDRYMVHSLQSARGCTFDCEFCPSRALTGPGLRQRRVERVAREARDLLAIERKPILFTENVFGAGDVPFVNALSDQLCKMDARYGVICDFFSIKPEVIRALAEGGCRLVLLNLTGEASPKELEAIEMIKNAGMAIWGYFMFGFETDGPYVFENTIRMSDDYDLELVTLTLLSPYPGTPMGERLDREDRIFDRRIDLYDQSHVVFNPKGMSAQELGQGYEHVVSAIEGRLHFRNAVRAMNS